MSYGVPSTVNHLMEKIFAYDRSANFNRQVLHIDANISSPSSKCKKLILHVTWGLKFDSLFLEQSAPVVFLYWT